MNFSNNQFGVNGQPLGMAWYKFLIKFGLIAGAVLNFIYAVNYITGGIYFVQSNGLVTAKQVYAFYGIYGSGLQVVDVFYGFFLIGFAIFAIVLRQKLAKFAPESLQYIKIFYSVAAVAPVLYAIMQSSIIGISIETSTVITAIVGAVVLILNIQYFNKRAHLFTGERGIPNQVYSQPTFSENSPYVFCDKCGTKLYRVSTFCHNCGNKITHGDS